MSPEERAMLERAYRLAEENNDILRSMQRMARISGIVRLGYWIVIILLSLGAYYFIQPYVDSLRDLYGGVSEGVQKIQGFPSSFSDF